MIVERRPLLQGVFVGLVVIVPVSVGVTVLEHYVDDLDGSAWMILPFLGILAAYVLAGFVAGRAAPAAPLSHGAVAALFAFGGWLLVRIVVPAVQGDHLGFGVKAVVTNAMLATAFGLFGGALSAREARV
jgi:hypothetical protein